jgi:hypothetical protein
MRRKPLALKIAAVSLTIALAVALSAPGRVAALDLGSVIKAGGIAVLVTQFGGQLDKFINDLTGNKNLAADQATKVVPILSLGSGTYLGAAQVTGPRDQVERCKAVAQLEANFSGRTFRVRPLVPVDSINVTKVSRVKAVGVSAIIDVRL